MQHLLIAEVATDSCYQSLGISERSYQKLETCSFLDGRDFVQHSLALTDYSYQQVNLAFESTRSAYKTAKKLRCPQAKAKCDLALEQLRLARMEVDEAKQQILLIERQWILINESRSQDNFNQLKFGWVDGPKSYYVNTARLAIINTYDYLKIANLALGEAQLALCD